MADRVWMRAGDQGDYEDFDNPFDAGNHLSAYFEAAGAKRPPKVSRYGKYGVEVGSAFTGHYDYVSLFWGDDDAQPVKEVSGADVAQFRAGIADGLYVPTFSKKPLRSKPAKPKSRKPGAGAATMGSVRR